jgi:type VI protein secretion system component Hcp
VKRQQSISWLTLVRHIIVIAVGCFASIGAAHGQSDIFLCIAGVRGSSTDQQFAGCSNVFNYSQAVKIPITPEGEGPGGPSGRVVGCGRAVIIKQIDAASPVLFIRALTGTRIERATVHFRTRGEDPREFLTFELQDVFVRSIENSESSNGAGGLQLPSGMETLTLVGVRVFFTFTPQNADGTAGAPIQGAYDCAANRIL